MINILQEIIKILHEKMLKAINFYWLHNDTLEKTNSLNGYYNQPFIHKQWFVIPSFNQIRRFIPGIDALIPEKETLISEKNFRFWKGRFISCIKPSIL